MDEHLHFGRQLAAEGLCLCLESKKLHGRAGEKLGSSTGSSMEFQDYRDYQPGDDLRRIDWAAYARSDKLTVRLYREEIQPRADIISDISNSMIVPSQIKTRAAEALAGLFAEASFNSEISVSWWSFGSGWKRLFPPSNSFPQYLEPEYGGNFDIIDEYSTRVPAFASKGIRICISDFLWETDPAAVIKRLSENAAELILTAVLCEEELDPPLYGASTFIDAESTDKLDISVTKPEKEAYLKRLDCHIEMWQDASASAGARFCIVKAEDILSGNIRALTESGILEYV